MARQASFAVLIAIILGTVLLVGGVAVVSVWPDIAAEESQADTNTVGFAGANGAACPLEASQYVHQTFTYTVMGHPYTVKVATSGLRAILTVNGESTPSLGVGESATLTTGTTMRVKTVTSGTWGNRVMFCLTPETAVPPNPTPNPPPPNASDIITCPIDGTVFEPENSDFLGLVGNELQIAIYYNASLPYLAQKYAEAGVTHVRVAIDWRSIESTQGTFNWAYTDQRVGAFPPEGIAPVGVIDAVPQWASSCPASNRSAQCTPADLDDYRAFVRTVVRRYGPAGTNTVHDWEIRTENGWCWVPMGGVYYPKWPLRCVRHPSIP